MADTIDTQAGDVEVEDFDWGFTFSDSDDGDAVVQKTTQQVAADLGPITQKLDAILALIPTDGVVNAESVDVDLSGIDNKLDQIIALERVDALTAGDMPDLSPIEDKLEELLNNQLPTDHSHEPQDLSTITDKLDILETTIGEVRDLDFDSSGTVDFGDINNNLADLIGRQEAAEVELEAKKKEFEEFKLKKLKAVEKLIVPLLKNLKSNPDKAYIHWPNRAGVIDAQISKILSITR